MCDINAFFSKFFNKTNYLENMPVNTYNIHHLELLCEYQLINQKRKILTKYFPSDKNIGHQQCMARIQKGTQCSRKCKDDTSEFCGCHSNVLPYGRIDEQLEEVNTLIEKKTRGRKSHNKTNIDLEQIDLSLYIKTTITNINGKELLIDENNVIYENDRTNTIIGILKGDNDYQWFD